MLLLENPICTSFIFNELRRRHCQRALLGCHYPSRGAYDRGRWARGQTRGAIDQNLAERWCWQAPRRDDARVTRRLYQMPVVDGVYQLDEGTLLDDVFSCLPQLGVVDLLNDVRNLKPVQTCQLLPSP
jgi:hypothetical protein